MEPCSEGYVRCGPVPVKKRPILSIECTIDAT